MTIKHSCSSKQVRASKRHKVQMLHYHDLQTAHAARGCRLHISCAKKKELGHAATK